MSEDCWRLSRKTRRCFDDTPSNLSTIYETNLITPKSSLSSHVRISNRFYQFVTTRYTTDFYIIKLVTRRLEVVNETSVLSFKVVDNFFMIIQSALLISTRLSSADHRRWKLNLIFQTEQRKTFSGEKLEEKINLIILWARHADNESLNKAIVHVFCFNCNVLLSFIRANSFQ